MKKYLNQTTVNVIALVTAAAWGACLVGNVLGVGKGPDKAMKEQQDWLNSLEDDMLFEKELQGARGGQTNFSDNVNKALKSIKTNP